MLFFYSWKEYEIGLVYYVSLMGNWEVIGSRSIRVEINDLK